jgi:HD-GYP domain-containing protein (c-di-GMP phosphodiesterase class II)
LHFDGDKNIMCGRIISVVGNMTTMDYPKILEKLTSVSLALSAEKDIDRLLEIIVIEAQAISGADGGSLYIRKGNQLEFVVARNASLSRRIVRKENATRFVPIPLYDADNKPNEKALSVYSVLHRRAININNVAEDKRFDFAGVKAFDKENNYTTQSILTIPLLSRKDKAIGCLQLINATNPKTGKPEPFPLAIVEVVQTLAAQASIILDNKQLADSERDLLEAFIKLIAEAIDKKSPYTGAHCTRVPELTEMIAEAACEAKDGHLKDFNLTDEEKYELHIAGWLHDCGKVVTPVHVMDKSTKLETIWDRVELVRLRFELLKREAEIRALKGQVGAALEQELAHLEEDFAFLENTNKGGEFLNDEAIERLKKIAARTWQHKGKAEPALTENEMYNLSIRRGTLNTEERKIMEGHMVATVDMLDALPFPDHLKRVPEYACGHHERMDGKGYPKSIKAGTMSIPARMMAIADVFEALTASDRPYKPAKKLSETMNIISKMKEDNHLDPMLVDFFVSSGVYRRFAAKYLSKELIDAVDEAKILAAKPKPMQ